MEFAADPNGSDDTSSSSSSSSAASDTPRDPEPPDPAGAPTPAPAPSATPALTASALEALDSASPPTERPASSGSSSLNTSDVSSDISSDVSEGELLRLAKAELASELEAARAKNETHKERRRSSVARRRSVENLQGANSTATGVQKILDPNTNRHYWCGRGGGLPSRPPAFPPQQLRV